MSVFLLEELPPGITVRNTFLVASKIDHGQHLRSRSVPPSFRFTSGTATPAPMAVVSAIALNSEVASMSSSSSDVASAISSNPEMASVPCHWEHAEPFPDLEDASGLAHDAPHEFESLVQLAQHCAACSQHWLSSAYEKLTVLVTLSQQLFLGILNNSMSVLGDWTYSGVLLGVVVTGSCCLLLALIPVAEKVVIEGVEVYSHSVGRKQLNECTSFDRTYVSDVSKPSIMVCGTQTKLTVFLRNECQGYSSYRHEVGICSTEAAPTSCVTASPATKKWLSQAQSYKIEQCGTGAGVVDRIWRWVRRVQYSPLATDVMNVSHQGLQ